MKGTIIAGGLAALATSVHANPPRYDVEAYCTEIAGFGGEFSSMMYSSCFSQEQSAYDALKADWAAISPQIKSYCNNIATFGSPGSYLMLQSCVEMEEAASNQNNTFKY